MDTAIKLNLKKISLNEALAAIPHNLKPVIEQTTDKGASSWLNALPLKNQDFDLNKEDFRDALRLRYGVSLENLLSMCACGERFNVNHALSCKKGGFVTNRHNNLRDSFTVLLNKVCINVQNEPHLLPVTNETFQYRTANIEDGARLDMKASGFWRRGQTAFFDVRVTHVNSQSNSDKTTSKIFHQHEQAKKREYNKRVLEIEHGTFTPLIFGTNGGMGQECTRFVSALANKLAEKQSEDYSVVMYWLRVRISFVILRSVILCVRGSRTPFRVRDEHLGDDLRLNNIECDLM